MFVLKKIWCRTFQTGFRMIYPFLPYREPQIISSCANLSDVFKKENARSALIVTDKGIMANGLLEPLKEALESSHVRYTIYDQTRPNPTTENVHEALRLYYENKCDTLIGIGGGSSIDCAKTVGACVAYPKRNLNQLKGKLRIWRKLPTLIAIPTTAGTGSEVTLASLITDESTRHKYALMSFPLIPSYAVLDATLTYSLPPHLTASTGMDALTHAVEAYIGQSTTQETRALSLEAVRLIFENIEAAYADGCNYEARNNMLHAAYKAGQAFSKSYVGYIHAIAHSLGGRYGTPHGLANTVIMPYVLEAYGPCIHRQLHELGVAAGVCSPSVSDREGSEAFIAAIKALNARMGIPCKLSGIRAGDIPEMARYAEKEANPLYPVPKLMIRKELEAFYYEIGEDV